MSVLTVFPIAAAWLARPRYWPLVSFCFVLFVARPVLAQLTGVLYDPEPPADAAYVRIIHLTPNEQLDVLVDGKPRQAGIREGKFGDYMVLRAGPHELQLLSQPKAKIIATTRIDVRPAQVLTLAYTIPQSAPQIFEDKTGLNRMKANITVYHLADKSGEFNISTADGKTSVFRALAPLSSHALAVNPIKVELLACPFANQPAGKGDCSSPAAQQARVALVLERGDNYSLLLTLDAHSVLQVRVSKNAVEAPAHK
ncbi:DUF4397 domain-containing protein [Undibacterium sp. Di27W]|uniref:DUF4397 domain-containing protein n=1 Tax=Undibacterium sp. Di27W TaxID=3413036 RepID=UPI003BF3C592